MRCVNGRVEMDLECEPRLDYGRKSVSWEYDGPAYGTAVARGEGVDVELHLTTDLRIGFEGGRARARSTLRDGDTAFVALSWSEHAPPRTYDEAYHRLVYTADAWHEWLSHGDFPDHPWRTYLQRSALTLKGLTYAPTGAMVAAATTSLPETPHGERNWDYRYSWIRDSTFMLWGLYTLGFDGRPTTSSTSSADVAGGRRGPADHVRDRRRGPADRGDAPRTSTATSTRRPVRVGNAAYAQRQHDVWGAMLDSVLPAHEVARRPRRVDLGRCSSSRSRTRSRTGASPTAGSGRCAASRSHFTSSKVMCWVACDRGARLARMREDHERAQRWQEVADEIHEDVCAHGSTRVASSAALRHDALDASLPAHAARALPAAGRPAHPSRPSSRSPTS